MDAGVRLLTYLSPRARAAVSLCDTIATKSCNAPSSVDSMPRARPAKTECTESAASAMSGSLCSRRCRHTSIVVRCSKDDLVLLGLEGGQAPRW